MDISGTYKDILFNARTWFRESSMTKMRQEEKDVEWKRAKKIANWVLPTCFQVKPLFYLLPKRAHQNFLTTIKKTWWQSKKLDWHQVFMTCHHMMDIYIILSNEQMSHHLSQSKIGNHEWNRFQNQKNKTSREVISKVSLTSHLCLCASRRGRLI